MTIEKLTELVKELARQHNELEKRVDALTELIGLASPGDPLANRVAALEARLMPLVLFAALEARLKEKP